MCLSVTLFPVPLCPRRQNAVPCSTSSDTSLRTGGPPKAFATNVGGERLARLLTGQGFAIESDEMLQDSSRSSSVPIRYVRAARAS